MRPSQLVWWVRPRCTRGSAWHDSKVCTMQGDRYSIAYFANGRARTILQGPKKKYPPIKFEQIVAQKSKYLTEEEMTSDDKYVEWQKKTA